MEKDEEAPYDTSDYYGSIVTVQIGICTLLQYRKTTWWLQAKSIAKGDFAWILSVTVKVSELLRSIK